MKSLDIIISGVLCALIAIILVPLLLLATFGGLVGTIYQYFITPHPLYLVLAAACAWQAYAVMKLVVGMKTNKA